MKKVCFVVQRFHPDIGGTEKICQEIVEYVKNNSNYDISIITTPNSARNKREYSYKIYECDFDHFYLMKEHFEIFNYDMTIFFCDLQVSFLNLYDVKWCKNNICVLNLDENIYKIKHLFKDAINNLKNFNNVITFTKDGIANKFLEENKIKNTYIPNFSRDVLENIVDISFVNKLNLNNKKKNILYNAAFESRKNQEELLNIISSSKKLKNYNWIFIGTTPNEKYLNRCLNIIKNNKLEDIKMIKSTTNTIIVDKLYQISDCVVLVSKAEGMPLVLLEAMSAGKPIVSTDVGGVKGVLSDITEISVLPINFSSDQLENAIEKQLQINFNYREIWKNNFNKEYVCKKYLDKIQEYI